MAKFILGGGCFWCLDSSYMQVAGVDDVVVGYMGGESENPGYEAVCSGLTGHVEVAEVSFDESLVSADVVLDMFFTMHDPTQLNRQGHDVGTQYRSVMFYTDESQRELFEAAIERAKQVWGPGIVTAVEPASVFWPAEEYHQDFFDKNPFQGYCNAVVAPKMAKIRQAFTSYLR
ncbi:MAG: hypothetical protein RIS82_381 [Actinomycetota bacterium]|jgi:peptide-methionine (S)-S-oxide reductase